MKQCPGLIVCLTALLAAGCGTKPAAAPVAPAPLANLTGNWQIQSGAPSTSSTGVGVVLLGALQNTGPQVTGTFRFSNLAQSTSGCALNQVVTVTGTLDALGNLTLTSAALADGTIITAELVLPPVLTNFATGTIAVSGKTCAFPSAAALAEEIATITGTYAGPLTPISGLSSTGGPGSSSFTLTQSAAPAADGQFPVTGSLAYTFRTCTGTYALSGTASGISLLLTSTPISPQLLPNVRFIGFAAPTAGSITLTDLLFSQFPCGTDLAETASFEATLAKQ